MVYLTVKKIKQQLHIHVRYDSYAEFQEQFAQKLALLSSKGTLSAFFYLPKMSDKEALVFLNICKAEKITLLGINPQKREELATRLEEGTVRSGQKVTFSQPLLLFGSIHSSAVVTSSHSITVMGRVSGVIDLLHRDCVLYASSLQNARIRIADTPYAVLNSLQPCKVYYDSQCLKTVASE